MGCNPDEGTIRMLDENFNQVKAKEQGFTSIFSIGEMIRIKDCYFEVNNFVEEHSFMNLKLIKNEEALDRMATLISQGKPSIPTTMEGDNPMDRIANAEIEINKIIKNKEAQAFNEGCAWESTREEC